MVKIFIVTLCLVEIYALKAKFFEERSDVLRQVSPESVENSGCWDDISLRIRDICLSRQI